MCSLNTADIRLHLEVVDPVQFTRIANETRKLLHSTGLLEESAIRRYDTGPCLAPFADCSDSLDGVELPTIYPQIKISQTT